MAKQKQTHKYRGEQVVSRGQRSKGMSEIGEGIKIANFQLQNK